MILLIPSLLVLVKKVNGKVQMFAKRFLSNISIRLGMRPCRFSRKLPMTSKKFDRRLEDFSFLRRETFGAKGCKLKRIGRGVSG